MKYSIYGRKTVEILRQNNSWQVFYLGNEGKRRPAEGVVIPPSVAETDLADYLDDLFHELATPEASRIERLED